MGAQVRGVQVAMVLCCVWLPWQRSFFRIPRVVSNKGEELHSLSKKQRDRFLAAISRVGLTEKILKNDRICFTYYISGKPADLLDETSPDWLPSLHLG